MEFVNPESSVLRYRLISAICLIAALAFCAMWIPFSGLLPVLIVVATLVTIEFSDLLAKTGHADFRICSLAAPSVILISSFLMIRADVSVQAPSLVGGYLGATAWGILVLIRALFAADRETLFTVGSTFLNMAMVTTPFVFLLGLLGEWPQGDGRWLVIYVIAVVKANDTAAYFSGRWWGQHKMFPRISPAKTWEGCAGGVFFSIALSSGIVVVAGEQLRPDGVAVTLVQGILCGVLLSGVGILGDLLESMVKRSAGTKDSGQWIRGMGGILDVMDSLLLAFIVFYIVRFLIL